MLFLSRITCGAVEVCDMTHRDRGTRHVHVVVVVIAIVHHPILIFGGEMELVLARMRVWEWSICCMGGGG